MTNCSDDADMERFVQSSPSDAEDIGDNSVTVQHEGSRGDKRK
jgi:hypothetical protein